MINVSGSLARNSVTMAVVVGVHLLLIYALSRMRSVKAPVSEQARTTWIVIPKPERTIDPASSKSTRTAGSARRLEEDSRSLPITDLSQPTAIQQPATNWREEVTKSIDDIAKRHANEKWISPQTPDPIYSAPVYKLGDSYHFDDGEIETWINSRCYATNQDFGEQRSNPNTVVSVCKGNVGKPLVRRDMFDHLKPAYLKDPKPNPGDDDRGAAAQETR